MPLLKVFYPDDMVDFETELSIIPNPENKLIDIFIGNPKGSSIKISLNQSTIKDLISELYLSVEHLNK